MNAKFDIGSKVAVQVEKKTRLGKVASVKVGTNGGRRTYAVVALSNGADLGNYRSDELQAR